MNDMNQLLPCPFCGAKAKIKYHPADDKPDEIPVGDFFEVYCTQCRTFKTSEHNDKESAISAWNTRQPPDAVQGSQKQALDNDGSIKQSPGSLSTSLQPARGLVDVAGLLRGLVAKAGGYEKRHEEAVMEYAGYILTALTTQAPQRGTSAKVDVEAVRFEKFGKWRDLQNGNITLDNYEAYKQGWLDSAALSPRTDAEALVRELDEALGNIITECENEDDIESSIESARFYARKYKAKAEQWLKKGSIC